MADRRDRRERPEPAAVVAVERSPRGDRAGALTTDDDLPVVARMVIEVRSDGTRTVARGAIEDVASGQKTAVVARGGSPLALAADLTRGLTRGLVALPRFGAAMAIKRLLGRR